MIIYILDNFKDGSFHHLIKVVHVLLDTAVDGVDLVLDGGYQLLVFLQKVVDLLLLILLETVEELLVLCVQVVHLGLEKLKF